MRFLGLLYEAQGSVIKAQEIYLDLIESNPSDSQTIKRLVCLFRDMEMLSSALVVLNKYVEVNQEDHEAWLELSDIYASKGNYSKAIFCIEEVLSANPKNYLLNLRYAEILYSSHRQDRIGDLLLARKYFSHAAILKEDEKEPCVRALLGLVRTCKQISAIAKKGENDDKNKEVLHTAQRQIKAYYARKGSEKLIKGWE
ncbi:MAG: tetratricopeptide repeat protein [bacterium]